MLLRSDKSTNKDIEMDSGSDIMEDNYEVQEPTDLVKESNVVAEDTASSSSTNDLLNSILPILMSQFSTITESITAQISETNAKISENNINLTESITAKISENNTILTAKISENNTILTAKISENNTILTANLNSMEKQQQNFQSNLMTELRDIMQRQEVVESRIREQELGLTNLQSNMNRDRQNATDQLNEIMKRIEKIDNELVVVKENPPSLNDRNSVNNSLCNNHVVPGRSDDGPDSGILLTPDKTNICNRTHSDIATCSNHASSVRHESNEQNEISKKGRMNPGNLSLPNHLLNEIPLPKFSENKGINPKQFLIELDEYLKLKQIPDDMIMLIVRKCLDIPTTQWLDLIIGQDVSYDIFKKSFMNRFWNHIKQRKLRMDLANGKYDSRTDGNMIEYILKIGQTCKLLDPPLPEMELISTIINHFPPPVRNNLIVASPADFGELVDLMMAFENSENAPSQMEKNKKPINYFATNQNKNYSQDCRVNEVSSFGEEAQGPRKRNQYDPENAKNRYQNAKHRNTWHSPPMDWGNRTYDRNNHKKARFDDGRTNRPQRTVNNINFWRDNKNQTRRPRNQFGYHTRTPPWLRNRNYGQGFWKPNFYRPYNRNTRGPWNRDNDNRCNSPRRLNYQNNVSRSRESSRERQSYDARQSGRSDCGERPQNTNVNTQRSENSRPSI